MARGMAVGPELASLSLDSSDLTRVVGCRKKSIFFRVESIVERDIHLFCFVSNQIHRNLFCISYHYSNIMIMLLKITNDNSVLYEVGNVTPHLNIITTLNTMLVLGHDNSTLTC